MNNGVGSYNCTCATQDGVFTGIFEFSEVPFTSANGNVTCKTGDVKITILIHNFPYSVNDSNVRLAILALGEAADKYEDHAEDSDDDHHKKRNVTTSGAGFSWVTEATCDNVLVAVGNNPVNYTGDDNGNRFFGVYLSFDADRPSSVNWDPVATLFSGAGVNVVMMGVVMLLLLGLF